MRANKAAAIKMGIFAAITLLLTGVLAMTVANTTAANVSSYNAEFADASGLAVGNDVRINGVKVGKVTNLDLTGNSQALVRFEVDASRKLGRNTSAVVKFRNIAGQRYLALDAAVRNPSDVMAPETTIPVNRTRPALNLTELFNGFKPLFQALSPDDVNKLSFEIIQVFQGEGSTVESLLAHTASLTSTIAKKDEVIGKVIDNLTHVMGTVSQHGPQLSQLIDSLQRTVSGLAEQRKPIGEAVTSLDSLTNSTAGFLEQARPPLKQDVAQLNTLAGTLDGATPQIEDDLRTLPDRLNSLSRTASYGSWFNYYLCQASGNFGIGSLNVKMPLNPINPADMPARCKK